jgi:catechol 2,3-dioxygenase-like lactoylglutathione lyase family enzyme
VRPIPADWRPSDVGYSRIGFHVIDFDAILARIARTSGVLLSDPIGKPGQRRVCLRDPDGIVVELMEDDIRPGGDALPEHADIPVTARSITLSVPDLRHAERFWVDALGLVKDDGGRIHTDAHEEMWGLGGASKASLLLWAGDFAVELVEYATPRYRPRPAGYMLSDQGILNIALGTMDRSSFDRRYAAVLEHGYTSNAEPWTLSNVATVVYVNDDQGFNVELLHVEPSALQRMGFRRGSHAA